MPAFPVDCAPFTEQAAQRAEEGVPLDAVVRTYFGGARPSHWAQILDLAGIGDPQATANQYIALRVPGMAAAEPDVKPADHLTSQGMEVLGVVRDGGCLA